MVWVGLVFLTIGISACRGPGAFRAVLGFLRGVWKGSGHISKGLEERFVSSLRVVWG